MEREEILKVAKPILFNTEMVRAILYGVGENIKHYKTCTRRVRKDHVRPAYKVGDYLYVRETWRVGAWDIHRQLMAFDYKDGTCGEMVYIHNRDMFLRLIDQAREDARKAGCKYNGVDFVWEKGESPYRWHPSIHMPKEVAKLFLQVTAVRKEHLQDMDGFDALYEGVNTLVHPQASYFHANQLKAFAKLWDSTIKKKDLDKYGWDANPWVWVYEFERVEV